MDLIFILSMPQVKRFVSTPFLRLLSVLMIHYLQLKMEGNGGKKLITTCGSMRAIVRWSRKVETDLRPRFFFFLQNIWTTFQKHLLG